MNAQFFQQLFPNAAYFLGVVFHQDWEDDYETPRAAVKGFVDRESADVVKRVRFDLERIGATEISPSELDDVLLKIGCYYDYMCQGVSGRSWLKEISEWLATRAA